MCGILCVFKNYRGAETVKEKVIKRARRIRHRGPDWSGLYIKGENLMAHERLSIVGVDSGAQPLYSEDKSIVLCVNGEIYNHKQLREGLKTPGTFLTESDCEVIIHLYKEHGVAGIHTALNQLNGIFGIALLDESTNTFIIARDHVGIIPLYWGRDQFGAVWVSSELKGLHDVCVTFEDFPPGKVYVSATDTCSRWYQPDWYNPEYMPTKKINLDVLRENMIASVKRQLMSDVPYGVLLSGGLDSSLISAIAARLCSKRVEEDGKTDAWYPRLHSFSIGLPESPDLAAAAVVAKSIGTIHHAFTFTVEEGINAVRDVIYHLETYDVTTVRAATPMYLMSRKIKAMGVKMVLSGEGADEVFGGYLYFHKCPNKEEMQQELTRKVKGLYKFDNLRANKSTAAWGVEARVPFLDREFLDYCLNEIDPTDKMCGVTQDGRIEKWVLREAFKGYLPEEVLWRQKEQFSDGVGYSWIDSLKDNAEKQVTDEQLANAKYRFPHNPPPTKEAYFVRMIYDEHYPGDQAANCVPGGPSVACSSAVAIKWDESFKNFADCSGRSVLGVHNSAYSSAHREKLKEAAVDLETAAAADLSFCADVPGGSEEPAKKKLKA